MAKMPYKGDWIKADVYRLSSSKPAYEFQFCYHHKTKKLEAMAWRGQYPNGTYTDYYTLPASEFAHWQRRIKAGEAKPEMQRASEYTMKVTSGNIEATISYLNKIDAAGEWWQGERVKDKA